MQILLSLGLIACLVYVVGVGRGSRLFKLPVAAVIVTGFVFVWSPGLTDLVAAQLGVGRGADVVIYVWIVTSLLVVLQLHFRIRHDSERITELARAVALNGATPGDAERR